MGTRHRTRSAVIPAGGGTSAIESCANDTIEPWSVASAWVIDSMMLRPQRNHRLVIALAPVLSLVLGLVLFVAPPARAESSDSAGGRLFQLTNASRADAGLAAYAYAGDLASVALGQAQRMAAAHAISHNPNLADEVTNWLMVSENVGRGPDADSLHQAFMDSPLHRRAILSPDSTEMGIGVVQGDDGRIYVSEVFRAPLGQAAASAPAAAPADTAAPPAPVAADPAPSPPPATRPAPPAPVAAAPAPSAPSLAAPAATPAPAATAAPAAVPAVT